MRHGGGDLCCRFHNRLQPRAQRYHAGPLRDAGDRRSPRLPLRSAPVGLAQLPVAGIVEVAERLPVIVLARRIAHPAVDNVRTADEHVVDVALEHLTSIGHRDIAHLNGGRIHGASDRQRSYRKLMRSRGLADRIRIYAGGNTEEARRPSSRGHAHGARSALSGHRVQRPIRHRPHAHPASGGCPRSPRCQRHRLRRHAHGVAAVHLAQQRRAGHRCHCSDGTQNMPSTAWTTTLRQGRRHSSHPSSPCVARRLRSTRRPSQPAWARDARPARRPGAHRRRRRLHPCRVVAANACRP